MSFSLKPRDFLQIRLVPHCEFSASRFILSISLFGSLTGRSIDLQVVVCKDGELPFLFVAGFGFRGCIPLLLRHIREAVNTVSTQDLLSLVPMNYLYGKNLSIDTLHYASTSSQEWALCEPESVCWCVDLKR